MTEYALLGAEVVAVTGLVMGLALFGVLSIIRLRSTEPDQHEVAYFFSAPALDGRWTESPRRQAAAVREPEYAMPRS